MINPKDNFRTNIVNTDIVNDEGLCPCCEIRRDCELKGSERENCEQYKQYAMVACGSKYISDGIGDHFKVDVKKHSDKWKISKGTVDKWEPKQPVFISAQTGKGKNYFVEESLIEHVRAINHKNKIDKKILVISNRQALRYQIENRIKKEDGSYKKGDYIRVISYQRLLKNLRKFKEIQSKTESNYMYVVCDEAHFFTHDGMFNPDTANILSEIIKTFKNAIRIYMTATPYECFSYISDYESNEYNRNHTSAEDYPPYPVFYHFKRDYSYLDVKYYSETDELVKIISNSNNEKWLVFINSKKKCKSLKDKLDKANENSETLEKNRVITLDATKKDSESFDYIVEKERFPKDVKVVITTSVMDNGINFTDDSALRNVVVTGISKTECLQMVGRVRRDSDNSKITLYLKRVSEKAIKNQIGRLENQREAYHAYDLAIGRDNYYKVEFEKKYIQGKAWNKSIHWFGTNSKYAVKTRAGDFIYYPNEIARLLVETKVIEYRAISEGMVEEMRNPDYDKNKPGQAYLEQQLSWFDTFYNPENDIALVNKNDGINKLAQFLIENSATPMYGDEKDNFRKEITLLIDQNFGRQDKNKKRVYNKKLINSVIESTFNYTVKSKRSSPSTDGKKLTYWIIEPTENNE